MLDIFLNKNQPHSYAIKQWSKWDYIKRVSIRELNKITDYYHGRSKVTNNNHILSRLVKFLTPDIDLPIADYFKYVDTSSAHIARRFDFVTNSWKGKVLKDIFYQDEYVIFNYVTTDFNIFKIATTWRNLSPIRLIYTNEYTLDYYQFDKTKSNPFTTINILEVDVNLLLLMYKYWAIERRRLDDSTNANYFIAQVILPNMVKSSMDIILFNRFYNLYYRNPMESSNTTMYMTRHPFHVIDFHKNIDSVYRDVIDKVKHNSMPLEQLLLTIPTLCHDSMIDTLFINRPFYTRQSEWVIWVSRVRYIYFFLEILGEKGRARNAQILNKMPALIKMLKNRSTDIISQLPSELWIEVDEYIEKISDILGRR